MKGKKVHKKWSHLFDYFFDEKSYNKLIDYFRPVLNLYSAFILSSPDVAKPLRISLNLLINLFLETKYPPMRQFILELNEKVLGEDPITLRLKFVMEIVAYSN